MKTTSFHRALLLLAGLLLSLHSLVPHVHSGHSDSSGEVSAEIIPGTNGDLLGLLQNFFTNTDLGEDHLEHFSSDNHATLDLEVIALLPPADLPTIVLAPRALNPAIRRQRVFRSRHFPPAGVYPDRAAPRGPPALA
ncbi:hypothetical protein [Neolewinella persica]|uniref:hypothetical protein n=1 Tax=Neolewinella persica TaxID=70998 RepID=UPI000377E48C|nr:hypothetical protein [Neolewinella persica]